MTGVPTFGIGRIRWGWFIVAALVAAAAAARSPDQHADAAR